MDMKRSRDMAALPDVLRYALHTAAREAEYARLQGYRAEAVRLIDLAYSSLDLLYQAVSPNAPGETAEQARH